MFELNLNKKTEERILLKERFYWTSDFFNQRFYRTNDFTKRVQWENERNRWKVNNNFENNRNYFFRTVWKNTIEMGRLRTMNERNEKSRTWKKMQVLGFSFYFEYRNKHVTHELCSVLYTDIFSLTIKFAYMSRIFIVYVKLN